MTNLTALTPGSPPWWAALAHVAAVRAWCYHQVGMAAAARRWAGIAADASAALCRTVR